MPKRKHEVEQFDLMPCVDRAIDALVLGNAEVEDGMHALVAMGNALHTSPDWKKLAAVGWSKDLPKAKKWFTDIIRKKTIPCSAKGIWFGAPSLYMNAAVLELCAYKNFTIDDVNCGWARDRVYPPKPSSTLEVSEEGFLSSCMTDAARALDVQTSASLDDRMEQMEELMDSHFLAFFVASLGYSCLLVAQLCRELDPALLRGTTKLRGVAVGFAEGGHHQIGAIDKLGWHPRPICWLPSADEDDED